MSRQGKIMVKVRSKQGQGNVKRRLRPGQGKAKARSRRGQGKVKVKSRQHNHNLNRNYNLMGFDTIEINLVILCFKKYRASPLFTLICPILSDSF